MFEKRIDDSSIGVDEAEFLHDLGQGLRSCPKSIPCKYLYDERGSQLFEAICTTPEYYVTRTEMALLEHCAPQLTSILGSNNAILEFGSGAGTKIRMLLDALDSPRVYVPVDISAEILQRSARELEAAYSGLKVVPLVADYTENFSLPADFKSAQGARLVFFPGSTISNFNPGEARHFLSRIRAMLGKDGKLLMGVDLIKAPERLEAAYNDSAGYTAAFNLNLLHRIRRSFVTNIEPANFDHRATFNSEEGRIEMHLISKRDQDLFIEDLHFKCRAGEAIHTENSYKYRLSGLRRLAQAAGLQVLYSWTDENQDFSINLLRPLN